MSTFQNKNAGSNSEFAVFIELIKDLKNTILMLQEMIKNQNTKLCEYEERDKLTNRLTCLNNKIELDWLNLSLNSFKIHCKQKFLS